MAAKELGTFGLVTEAEVSLLFFIQLASKYVMISNYSWGQLGAGGKTRNMVERSWPLGSISLGTETHSRFCRREVASSWSTVACSCRLQHEGPLSAMVQPQGP